MTKRGVTLIEVLVASLILSFVLTVVVLVLQLNTKLSNKGVAEAFLQTNLQLATRQIGDDVRNGSTMSVPDTTTMEITDELGHKITWKYDKVNKKIQRNGSVIKTFGVDTANFNCKFVYETSKKVTVNLKLYVVKSNSFKATTGNSSLVYGFNCRNINS